jgi:hypothetical protein
MHGSSRIGVIKDGAYLQEVCSKVSAIKASYCRRGALNTILFMTVSRT